MDFKRYNNIKNVNICYYEYSKKRTFKITFIISIIILLTFVVTLNTLNYINLNNRYKSNNSILANTDGTYSAVQHNQAFVQIFPNGHHLLLHYENTTKFFIDYIINNGPAPPKIEAESHLKESGLIGDTLSVEVKVSSDINISSVQVVYRYLDIIGSCWEVFDLKKSSNNIWNGSLNPGIITSKLDYYIVIRLESKENIWFSSTIYTPEILVNNFTILFYIFLISFIFFPTFYLIRRRFDRNVSKLDRKKQLKVKNRLIIELSLIGLSEIIYFFSLLLPWVVFQNGRLNWTHLYIFNNLFTMKQFFGDIGSFLTLLFFVLNFLLFILSLMKPMLSGFLKIIYPIIVILIISFISILLANNIGMIYPGIGVYLMFFMGIFVLIIGIWKRKYQTLLRIRKPKIKRYNIDKLFKINTPTELNDQ